jgi:DNA-binding CsgD family transcriptional regulator/tetratricopeptide (TPR) repeat protein
LPDVATISPPPVVRGRVVERIAFAGRRRIVLIVAPAGYGKSIALGQFLASCTEPAIRYGVRAERADLLAFLRGFAESLAPVAPDARATLAGAFESNERSDSPGRDLATWMHAHLRDYRGTIAIDDLHCADGDPQVAAFCSTLVGLTKNAIRWILVSRTAFDLPAGTWLAYGDADLPVDEEDLRFTTTDLRAACDAAGLQIGDDEIAAMMALTGGWPTALGFALCSSARSSDLERVAAMTRDMAYSYFADQVYRTLDDGERALLESGALLDEFDAEVLVAAGFDRARPMLEDLRRRVAFMFEERPGVYRCQDLFRTFALHRVDRDGAAATAERRARLAEGLERCGRFAEALRMYVSGARAERVVELLERHGLDLLSKGHRDAVVEGIAALDERTRRERPLVVALRGIVAEGTGDYDEADRLLENALAQGIPPAARNAIVLRLARLRVNRGVEVGTHVRELAEGDGGSVERCDAIAMLAAAAARAHDGESARQLLERCAALVARIDDDDGRARILQRTGIAYLELGRVAEAEAALRAAESIATGRGLWSIATRASLGLSHIELFAHGDTAAALERAEKAATAAGRAGELRSVENAAASVLSIEVVRGEAVNLADFDRRFPHRSSGKSLSSLYIAAAGAQISAWEGRFGDAHRFIGGIVTAHVIDCDRAASYGLYALCLALDGENKRAAEAVLAARAILENSSREVFGAVFFDFARLFAALSEGLSGRHTSAQRMLKRPSQSGHQAAAHAYRAISMLERSRRTSLVVGSGFEPHLSAMASLGFGGYSKCLAAVRDHVDIQLGEHRPVRLTESERRILELLAADLAPKEIASELGRSVLTIQTHIQNVIGKFDCHGRAEAIALAKRRHLI